MFVQKVFAACSDSNFGQSELNLGDTLCLSDSTPVSQVYDTPAFLVNLIATNLFTFAGMIIFFLILYAGFKFISQGTKGKEEAKGIVTAAIVGLVIMLSAYWVLQIVKVLTGVDVGL
jgi:hypothetical protein